MKKTLNSLKKSEIIDIAKRIYYQYRLTDIDFETAMDDINSTIKIEQLTEFSQELAEYGIDELIILHFGKDSL
jgi:hypothetical protein